MKTIELKKLKEMIKYELLFYKDKKGKYVLITPKLVNKWIQTK
jgi:hypothetical protein